MYITGQGNLLLVTFQISKEYYKELSKRPLHTVI